MHLFLQFWIIRKYCIALHGVFYLPIYPTLSFTFAETISGKIKDATSAPFQHVHLFITILLMCLQLAVGVLPDSDLSQASGLIFIQIIFAHFFIIFPEFQTFSVTEMCKRLNVQKEDILAHFVTRTVHNKRHSHNAIKLRRAGSSLHLSAPIYYVLFVVVPDVTELKFVLFLICDQGKPRKDGQTVRLGEVDGV